MIFKSTFTAAFLAAITIPAPLFAADTAPAAAPAASITLHEGDPAPAIRFTEFVKGDAIQSLDPAKTYVIEFWSTTCAPCIEAMPHLTKMAKSLRGKVEFIGVNIWDKNPEKVRDFVKKQGDKMDYHVAIDADGFTDSAWRKAAGREGIPVTFVIVKGKVALIDDPFMLDTALLTGLHDGTIGAPEIAEIRRQEAACGNEFRASIQLPIETKEKRRQAIAKLRELAIKYPKAKYPHILLSYHEEELSEK